MSITRLIIYKFIEAPHSRDPLSITPEMFTCAMTYLQVMPAFLELVFPFGLQHYAQGFHFAGFSAENRLLHADQGLQIASLRRSGRQTEFCYSLKSVERTSDPHNPWSIRQCSIHHRFDIETEQATWVVVKGNSLVQDLVKSLTLNELTTSDARSQPQREDFVFSSTLKVHMLLAAWANESWQWYINDLEEKLQSITRPVIAIPVAEATTQRPVPLVKSQSPKQSHAKRKWSMRTVSQSMKKPSSSWSSIWSDRSTVTDEKVSPIDQDLRFVDEPIKEDFSFSDLQRVQFVHEKATEVLLVLKSNCYVLESLASSYSTLVQHEDFSPVVRSAGKSVYSAFHQTLLDTIKKMSPQESRVETLVQLISERKATLHALLQHINVQANNRLALEAKLSAKKMEDITQEMHEIARKTKVETVSMRIITLVTLFFLPGTFISTLMSTPIVNFPSNNSGVSYRNIGFGALEFIIAISLPLMCLTFAAWYIVHWREKRKEKRKREDEELGGPLNSV